MSSKTIATCLVFISMSCNHGNSQSNDNDHSLLTAPVTDSIGKENPFAAIGDIPLPAGFRRMEKDPNSFSSWLRNIALKKSRIVYLYNGEKKRNQSAQFAVLDIPVGTKDLQQCADAVMRLRASYLYEQKKFDAIIFFNNEGGAYRFSPPYNSQHFDTYLQTVFGMCGSASLSKQLKKTFLKDIEPGDVFIRGGFPGHAVMVLDVIVDKNGAKKYLLAQSYMPAQDIHVLLNPQIENGSPWYDVTGEALVKTPEYTFYSEELKKW